MNQNANSSIEITCHVDGQTYSVSSPASSFGVDRHQLCDQDQRHADDVTGYDLISIFVEDGVPVPYSCREGDCSSCIARLVKGQVEELPSGVLAATDRDLGYIVACRTLPRSAHLEITFDD